jgi:hypothetical protein
VPNIYVDLSDFKIVTDHPTIGGGHVVIGIRNHGSMQHELKVIKTDLAPDQLPVDGGTAKAKLVISATRAVDTVMMPSLIGKTQSEAAAMLEAMGLHVGTATTKTPSAPAGGCT